MSMKRFLVLLMVLLAGFSLMVSAATVHLTLLVGGINPPLNNAVKTYEHSHPNVKIDVIAVPYVDYRQKLALAIVGHNFPDLTNITTAYIPQAKNYLINLAPYLERNLGMSVESYRSQIVPSMNVFLGNKGQLIAIPMETTTECIWINMKMFKKAGILPPPLNGKKSPWTLDQFINALKKVKEVNHIPYALSYDYSADRFYNFLAIWGVTVLNEKAEFVLDKYPQASKLIDKFIDLFKDKIIPPAEWLSGASPQRDFFGGVTAAYWSGDWFTAQVIPQEKQVGGDYEPVYIPKGKDWFGEPGGSFLAAFKTGNSRKEKAAINFIMWMAHKNKGYLSYIVPGLYLSSYKNQKIEYHNSKMNKWQTTFEVLLSRAPAWTMVDRANTTWSKLYGLIRKQIDLGIIGQVTGKQIIQNLKRDYEKIVSGK